MPKYKEQTKRKTQTCKYMRNQKKKNIKIINNTGETQDKDNMEHTSH